MNDKITVITTYYKGKKYLRNLCETIYKNKKNLETLNVSVEYLIINDSPWDNIVIPAEFSEKGLDIRVYNNQANIGIHGSRINGVQKSTGNYILMLDQDDIISDDCLKEQYLRIGNADIIVCNGYKELAQTEKKIYKDRIKLSLVKKPEFYLKAANQIVSPGQCLIRKNSIPSEWMKYRIIHNGSDDLFLWLLLFAGKKKFVTNKKLLYRHNQVGTNLSNNQRDMCISDNEMCDISEKNQLLPESYINKRQRLCKFLESTDFARKIKVKDLVKYIDIILLKAFAYFI